MSSLFGKLLDLENNDLGFFCSLIEGYAGIHIKPTKRELVRTRLHSRIQSYGFKSFAEYRDLLSSSKEGSSELEVFTNLLTTNKTDFFREMSHFNFLTQKILPEWKKSGKTIKIWSSACSTGEEPYSLAMTLKLHAPKLEFKILATDIDTHVLNFAQNGVYSLEKKIEIPNEYMHFTQEGKKSAEGWFRVTPEIKETVTFKQHNLIEKTSPGENAFDLILCRNVLIYFSKETVNFVQEKMYTTSKPGGYFFIGHSESLQGMKKMWKTLDASIFQK